MAQDPISRVTRSKEAAKTTYDRLSRWYDWLEGSSEQRFIEHGLRRLDVSEGEQVAEIGFGTGKALVFLARAVGDTGEVYGVDLSGGMIRVAGERIRKAGVAQRAHLIRGDATRLPFASGRFDALFMSFALELFDTPDIATVLHECRRVLRPGGRICIVSLEKRKGVAVSVYEWGHRRFPKVLDCRPIHAREALEEAEFDITEADLMSMWGLPVMVALARRA